MSLAGRSGSVLALLLSIAPVAALADGARDLEDGIGFYENLDLERAEVRLDAASRAADLAAAGRARAFLYLGLLRFESGRVPEADAAWSVALSLDAAIAPPPGTSPRAVAALEVARERARSAPVAVAPVLEHPPPVEAPPAVDPPPGVEPPPVTVPVALPPAAATGDDSAFPVWVALGLGGLVVIGGAVAAALALGGGSECPQGDGGCLSIVVR